MRSGGTGQTYSLVSLQLSASPLPLTLYLTGLMNLSAVRGKLCQLNRSLLQTDQVPENQVYFCSDQSDELSG